MHSPNMRIRQNQRALHLHVRAHQKHADFHSQIMQIPCQTLTIHFAFNQIKAITYRNMNENLKNINDTSSIFVAHTLSSNI